MSRFIKSIVLLPGLLLVSSLALAQPICPLDILKPREVSSLDSFKKIAIMDQGRVKPLDTYAENLLLRFSGKRSFNRKPAIDWVARLLFAPRATGQDKVFLINHPEIPMALGIEPEKKRRYSFSQLEPGGQKLRELAFDAIQVDEKKRTIVDQEILRVYDNLQGYMRLMNVLSFSLPHPEFSIDQPKIIQMLDLSEQQNQFSFLDIILKADALSASTQSLQTKSPQDWTEQEKGLAQVLENIYHWTTDHSDPSLSIIPSLPKDDEAWISPWEVILTGFPEKIMREEILVLRDMTVHYWNGQQLKFDMVVRAFRDSIEDRVNTSELSRIKKMPLEIQYNRLRLFVIAKVFYALAFFVFLLSLLSSREILRRLGLIFVVLGFLPHLYAVILRSIIMSRPPVTSLYETFIFVSLMSVVLGIVIELVNKRWLGIVVASTCGFIFLMLSGKFASDGDSMQMLVAVLNSNFWLGTHVISISVGYAGCCVAGVMGHVYILQRLARPKDKALLSATQKNILGALGFGLALTFLGTTLGGIWADDSWGRFWGWDPKENGALLIILWCAIVFHAKAGKMIGPLGVAVGSVLGLIVVMWAWFGVNLLSVGLHSYGFTSGIASTLMIYVACEILFLGTTLSILKKKLI